MVKIRELEIIKAALEGDISRQTKYMDELQKKRMDYPLEVDVDKYNEFYTWLLDTKQLHKKVTLTLSNRLSEESRITSLENKIKMLEKQLLVTKVIIKTT